MMWNLLIVMSIYAVYLFVEERKKDLIGIPVVMNFLIFPVIFLVDNYTGRKNMGVLLIIITLLNILYSYLDLKGNGIYVGCFLMNLMLQQGLFINLDVEQANFPVYLIYISFLISLFILIIQIVLRARRVYSNEQNTGNKRTNE